MTGAEHSVGYDRLVLLLSEAVGQPAAKAAVIAAGAACGFDVSRLDERQQQSILRRISQSPGLIGVTAQLVAARLRMDAVKARLRQRNEEDKS